MANRASGMCIYNDAAVAIQALLDRGAERIAYIDVDAHHGNGCQWIFYEDPRVLTCSVHESGRYLYPGTGGLAERGSHDAEGTSINVPLPPYAGDASYLRAVRDVVAPAVRRFRPDVIVSMTGVDPHHTDPMAHLQVTTSRLPRAQRPAARPGVRRAPRGAGWWSPAAATTSTCSPGSGPACWPTMLEVRPARGRSRPTGSRWPGAGRGRLHADPLGRHARSPSASDERARADAQAYEVIDAARDLFGLTSR